MKVASKAFTLIELSISIIIISIMMLYLYKSYSSLNRSNIIIEKEVSNILNAQQLKKVVYLDFALAIPKTIEIKNRERNEDFVFMQGTNSLHKRHNPFVAYMVKNNKLYRLESLLAFTSHDLSVESEFDIDYLGEVENFRVYKSSSKSKESHLIHIEFKNADEILYRVNMLGEI